MTGLPGRRAAATLNEPARVALVTGAAGGLGRAIVDALSSNGWVVAGSARAGGEFPADMEDPAAPGRLIEAVVDRFGRLDLVCANHATMAMGAIDELPLADWWRIVEVNLVASFRLARSAVPHLDASRGSIIFTSSEWGLTGASRATAYAASKAGLIGLTKSLALELAPRIRVNAVCPGIVDTPQLLVDAADAGLPLAEMHARYIDGIPLRRIATPADIAAWFVFLAGPGAAFLTGQALSPNGGTTLVP